jgi:hypothetical protein
MGVLNMVEGMNLSGTFEQVCNAEAKHLELTA